MNRLVSTATMVIQLEGLLDTEVLDGHSEAFVRKLADLRSANALLTLSEPQLDFLASLYERHFA